MICSMTAFARESQVTEQGVLTVELRSVNHRYLDCSFKLPEALRQLEPKLREAFTSRLGRGKVECLMRLQVAQQAAEDLHLDEERLAQVLDASKLIAARLDAAQLSAARPVSALEVLQFPGVLGSAAPSDDTLLADARTLFQRSVDNLVDSRQREGEKLAALVLERLSAVEQTVKETRAIVPQLMQAQRERVISRIEALEIEVDENRLEQELVHMAQKADVDEELDRLEAHITEVRRALEKGGPCGRRLDFLMQELNREANTLSSKSISSATTSNAVELKVLIEQMREQIQNIE